MNPASEEALSPIRRVPFGVPLVMAIVAFALGAWQIDRAGQKTAFLEQLANAPACDHVACLANASASDMHGAAVSLTLTLEDPRAFFLANQVQNQLIGYAVFGVAQAENGQIFLLRRGWVAGQRAAGGALYEEEELPRQAQVRGRVYALQDNWLVEDIAEQVHGITEVQWASPAMVSRLLPSAARTDIAVVLDAQSPWALAHQDLFVPAVRPQRHYGYAFQWGLLGAVMGAVAVWLKVRRT